MLPAGSRTNGVFFCPCTPLGHYSCIMPHIGIALPSPTSRLQEAVEQVPAITSHRSHTLDRDFLTACML